MKKILLVIGFTLLSCIAHSNADFKSADITDISFTNNNQIIFQLSSGKTLVGNVLTKNSCPTNRLFHKIYFENEKIANSFKVESASGIKTCKWDGLKQI